MTDVERFMDGTCDITLADMTFEKFWGDNVAPSDEISKTWAKQAWNAALQVAIRHVWNQCQMPVHIRGDKCGYCDLTTDAICKAR